MNSNKEKADLILIILIIWKDKLITRIEGKQYYGWWKYLLNFSSVKWHFIVQDVYLINI